ncbi:unnamed protein product [Sphenostylis stenocarpa]|uniref:Cation/H+ exchanger domain-containing protein n=1 Tax=Sphenostylis stenocarpa TaxID=92480 RepID=A0AA86VRJ5_9FABA|nr:unnamed protein product [Sphenostylis stenocarpa]
MKLLVSLFEKKHNCWSRIIALKIQDFYEVSSPNDPPCVKAVPSNGSIILVCMTLLWSFSLNRSHEGPSMEVGQKNIFSGGTNNAEAFGGSFICHSTVNQINSKGIWFGDDPLTHYLPVFLVQLFLMFIFTHMFYLIIKPLGQPSFVSQVLGGVTLGPSFLGLNTTFADKIDPAIAFRSGKRTYAIGILGYFVPYLFSKVVVYILTRSGSLDHDVSVMLPIVIEVQCITAFPVITRFLSELQILNSEIGRLATSSSLVSEVCYMLNITVTFFMRLSLTKSIVVSIGSFLSTALLAVFVIFVIHPVALWAIQQSPEGKPVQEIYISGVLLTLLLCGLLGEIIGINALIVSFCIGLAIPDGPPLGAALVDKLDCFVSLVFLPMLFLIVGLRTDVYAIQKMKNIAGIELVICAAFCGKILGALLPLLYLRVPIRDAFSLGFILNIKGTVEMAVLIDLKLKKMMNDECFTIMVLTLLFISVFVSLIVKALYDPSKRFLAYKRRTIMHQQSVEQFRILACIHKEDNVLAILNLLSASNSNEASPIDLVVLQLIKLVGRSSSLLVAHVPRKMSAKHPTQTEKIFNSFTKFADAYKEKVTLHYYKGISPYATMHNDVCYLALEKRTTFIIIPFHKQWILGRATDSFVPFQQLNKKVLEKAPCSVGVLIDRGTQKKFWCGYAKESSYQVAMLFFGGADDREALSYARRMLDQPYVHITLFHFTSPTQIVGGTERSKMLDTQILSEFRLKAFQNERVSFKDETILNGRDVITVFEYMDSCHDLVMVGRRHADSKVMSELYKWKHGELGVVGEVLVSYNVGAQTSILVVQQQIKYWGSRDTEESYI